MPSPALAVCLSGIPWCTRCDFDEHSGDEVHRTTLEPSALLTVEVTQVTHQLHGAEPLEFKLQVHDEPALSGEQARQVAQQIVAAVEQLEREPRRG